MKIGIVSGYFNPLHKGHIEYINQAKVNCDLLLAIINNDYQVSLKGSKQFLDASHRALIIQNLKSIDMALISKDNDLSVSKTLQLIRSNFPNFTILFFNSGDRVEENWNKEELDVCRKCNIEVVGLDQPKISSSSSILSVI